MPFQVRVTDAERGVKRCARCAQEKPLDLFGKSRSRGGGGWLAYCKPCTAGYQRERLRHLAPEKRQEYRDSAARWARENPEKRRALERRRAMRRYGLTVEGYEKLLDAQAGTCAICGSSPIDSRAFPVDHDHETGLVRGILCPQCNVGLGAFRDNPEFMKRAIAYLGNPPGR